MAVLVQRTRRWAAATALAIAALAAPAAAQTFDVEADAALNVGYSQTTQTIFVPDPNGMPVDMPPDTQSRLFTEIRPGISVQSGSPRLTWRAGYLFGGTLSLVGDSVTAYSNQV